MAKGNRFQLWLRCSIPRIAFALSAEVIERTLRVVQYHGLDGEAESARNFADQVHSHANRGFQRGYLNKHNMRFRGQSERMTQITDALICCEMLNHLIHRGAEWHASFDAETAAFPPRTALYPAYVAKNNAVCQRSMSV